MLLSITSSSQHQLKPNKLPPSPAPPAKPLYSIAASVPGDLITDLQTAGMVGDPIYELNFKNGTLWDGYAKFWAMLSLFRTGVLPVSLDHRDVPRDLGDDARRVALIGAPFGRLCGKKFFVSPDAACCVFDTRSLGLRSLPADSPCLAPLLCCSYDWVYSTSFASPASNHLETLLVFDGIKMGATVRQVSENIFFALGYFELDVRGHT